MNRLDGKVALISGASRGIGGETARLMVEVGARVAIGDVLDERGRETARGLGEAALYVHLDVTSEADWHAAIAAALGRWQKLDILVNIAGLFLGKDIEAATLEEWHRLCAVNLTGVFLGTKLALPALREAAQASPHGSAIVNLASTAGIVGSTQDPLYSMTKGGVTLFTKKATIKPQSLKHHPQPGICRVAESDIYVSRSRTTCRFRAGQAHLAFIHTVLDLGAGARRHRAATGPKRSKLRPEERLELFRHVPGDRHQRV
jgi:NADP-dependent 3-hydroxy acid dehydrogenase YdfG